MLAVALRAGWAEEPGAAPHSLLREPAVYHGPEYDKPDLDVSEARIGLFAPIEPAGSVGHRMWAGASLAVERANRTGGWNGRPVRIVQRWAPDPWRGGGELLVRMALEERVIGVIGGPDGDSTHILAQVATKLRLPVLSPASGGTSLTRVNIPWVFVLPPGEEEEASAIARWLSAAGRSRVALVTGTDHDSRMGAEAMSRALLSRGMSPGLHLLLTGEPGTADAAADRLLDASPDSVLLWAAAPAREAFLRAAGDRMPDMELAMPLLPDARDEASPFPGTCRLLMRTRPVPEDLRAELRERYGLDGDPLVWLSFDAASMLIRAVESAGLNRARVADSVRALSGYGGVAGDYEWDNGGANRAIGVEMQCGSHAKSGGVETNGNNE